MDGDGRQFGSFSVMVYANAAYGQNAFFVTDHRNGITLSGGDFAVHKELFQGLCAAA
jgi:hypothetical protein